MKDNQILHGMVLYQTAVGENDKRMVILTKERGKITVFARGARRPGNANLALGPFAVGEFEVYEGRSSYTLGKASISNYFRELSLDPEMAYYGFYFLEVAGYYAVENATETDLLNLLYMTLRTMEKQTMDLPLLRRVFELKVLAIEGEYPNVFECAKCGAKDGLYTFSFLRQGLVCDSCKSETDMEKVLSSTVYTMKYVITSDLKETYAFNVTPEVREQFIYIVNKYFNMYVGYNFKSLEVLESMGVK